MIEMLSWHNNVREQVVAPACLQSYCVLRLQFLQHCCEGLQAAMAAADWRQLEASLFALAAVGLGLARIVALHHRTFILFQIR